MVEYTDNGIIKVNKEEYFNLYKKILKTCMEDGYLLPGLLESISVPLEYWFDEDNPLNFNITKESSSKRMKMMWELESKYDEISVPEDNVKEWFKEYVKIQNDELMEFINNYPEFNKILSIE